MLTTFESTIRQIMAPQQRVYDMLSNLENIEKVRDRLPADQIESISFDRDTVSISVAFIGAVTMKVVDREEPKTIKFEAANSPVPFNLWIQLLPMTDDTCKMKLTIKAELNVFIKGMVQKPLQEGLERMADVLQNIPY